MIVLNIRKENQRKQEQETENGARKTEQECLRNKKYRQSLDGMPESQKRYQNELRKTPRGKLNNTIGTVMRRSLKGNKSGRARESLVLYTVNDLKEHLEKLFAPGMSWGNYGEWHIDHKIPMAAFNFEKPEDLDFKRCWALTNLQPMWAIENIKKSDKVERPFQPSLLL